MADLARLVYGVSEVTRTSGTGAYKLAGALAGCYRFTDRLTDGDRAVIKTTDTVQVEFCRATFVAPDTLLRTEIISSSATGNKAISWPASGQRVIELILDKDGMVTDWTGSGAFARKESPTLITPSVADTRTGPITTGGAALGVTSDATNGINAAYVWSAVNEAIASAGATTRYDGIHAILVAPAGSTKSSSAISAYLISKFNQDIGITVEAVSDADGVSIWAANKLMSDNRGQFATTWLGRGLIGDENDFNVTSPHTQVFGFIFGGNSITQPALATAILCNLIDGYNQAPLDSAHRKYWTNFLQAVDGSTHIFATIGAKEQPAASIDSQTLEFHAYNSFSTLTTANLQWKSNSAFGVYMPTGGAFNVNVNGADVAFFSVNGSSFYGTITNDNAAGGQVGEVIYSGISSVAGISNGAATDIASISVSAGDWDLEGTIAYTSSGGAAITFIAVGLNTTANTFPGDGGPGLQSIVVPSTTFLMNIGSGRARFSVAGTTTIRVVGLVNYTGGSVTTQGSLTARRVR